VRNILSRNSNVRTNLVKAFIVSAASLLLSTAAAKIFSAFGKSKILDVSDPIIMLPYKYVFLLVGTIELVIAFICLTKNQTLCIKTGLIAWIATGFLAYRIGLAFVIYQKPCSCLGALTDALFISPQTADFIMKIILAYLLVGSYAALFWLRRRSKSTISTS
jgi:hypothetical protein